MKTENEIKADALIYTWGIVDKWPDFMEKWELHDLLNMVYLKGYNSALKDYNNDLNEFEEWIREFGRTMPRD